jgi:hypothetical protein
MLLHFKTLNLELLLPIIAGCFNSSLFHQPFKDFSCFFVRIPAKQNLWFKAFTYIRTLRDMEYGATHIVQ